MVNFDNVSIKILIIACLTLNYSVWRTGHTGPYPEVPSPPSSYYRRVITSSSRDMASTALKSTVSPFDAQAVKSSVSARTRYVNTCGEKYAR